jgi:hypothetical protein
VRVSRRNVSPGGVEREGGFAVNDEELVEWVPGVEITRLQARAIVLRILGWTNRLIGRELFPGESRAEQRVSELFDELHAELSADGESWGRLVDSFGLSDAISNLGITAPIDKLLAQDGVSKRDQAVSLAFMMLREQAAPRWLSSLLETALEHIAAPGVALQGEGKTVFKDPDGIVIDWVDNPNAFEYEAEPGELRQVLSALAEARMDIRRRVFRPGSAQIESAMFAVGDRKWTAARAQGRVVHNRPSEWFSPERVLPRRLRLFDWSLDVFPRHPAAEAERIRLHVNQAWYFQTMGSNHALEELSQVVRGIDAAERTPTLTQGMRHLRSSNLANLLSVNITVITRDSPPLVILQKRSDRNATATWPLQCTGAGFVDIEDGLGAHDETPNVFQAALRECQEEAIGIHFERGDIQMLALCREFTNFEPGVVGFVEIAQTGASVVLPPQRTDEVVGHFTVSFEPMEFFEWMQLEKEDAARVIARKDGHDWKAVMRERKWDKLGWHRIVPLGAMSIIFAMLHRFGSARVVAAWDAAEAKFDGKYH